MANALAPVANVFGGSKTFVGGLFTGSRTLTPWRSTKASATAMDPFNLFGGNTPKPPAPPDPVPVVPLPDPDQQDAARRRAIAQRRSGTGRASTIFTEADSGTLGG